MGTQLFSLEGKTAAITGATRGIDHSMALAEAGADIALLQRSPEQTELKEQIGYYIKLLG